MTQKINFVRVFFLVTVLTLAAPLILSPVLAQTPAAPAATTANTNGCPPGMDPNPVAGICFPKTELPKTAIEDILLGFMQWLFGIFGFLAIIVFVIAGIQYFLAAGNPETAKKAKGTMINGIIGIIIALSGFIIIMAISSFLEGYNYF